MSSHIDYTAIGWEQFEDLCTSLWFDEGYTNIKPMGRRREKGRDAVFVHEETGDLIIFQYKRWAAKYQTSDLKSMIKAATQKITDFKPKKFILNSAHEPTGSVNDWIDDLSEEMGFEIEYWDRSWTDLRLNNQRQDLRREYFGIDLVHHSWRSLASTCGDQVRRTVKGLSSKYDPDTYVVREVENRFHDYLETDKIGLAIVDRAGRGKTNLLCKLSNYLQEQAKLVILLRGHARLGDDNGIERLVVDAMGYETGGYQNHLHDVSRLLKEQDETCHVFIDGLTETDDLGQVNRALRNALIRLNQLGDFKLCFTCRDVGWAQVGYDLPKDLLYAGDENDDMSK